MQGAAQDGDRALILAEDERGRVLTCDVRIARIARIEVPRSVLFFPVSVSAW